MTTLNQNLTAERWSAFSLPEQLSNIGSDVYRATKWREKDPGRSKDAFKSALELIDLTIRDPKNHRKGSLTELCRLREVLADYFVGDNQYHSADKSLNKYFYQVNYKNI